MISIVEPSAALLTPIDQVLSIPRLLERCGRVCYKSEDKITDDSANRFLAAIIKLGHESVLEHANITYLITCSRACSHQLVRHRIGAFSQASQRFIDYGAGKKGFGVIVPPSIAEKEIDKLGFMIQCADAYTKYLMLRNAGVPPEDARFLLPNATKTELAVTFNVRQWRHVLKTRLNKHAQWEIRKVMGQILNEMKSLLPVLFADIEG